MATNMLRPDQLQHLLTTLEADYRQLIVTHRSPWRSAEDQDTARQVLAGSVTKARHAIQSLQGVSEPQLQQLVSKLVVQSELADDAVKNPAQLRY